MNPMNYFIHSLLNALRFGAFATLYALTLAASCIVPFLVAVVIFDAAPIAMLAALVVALFLLGTIVGFVARY
jgi:ABC-type uncharacterized transport system permease subunit